MRNLTPAERSLMTHVSMWGSDGYPITQLKRGWIWGTSEVKGPPVVFKTKREAIDSFEAFHNVLIEAYGEEARQRALAGLYETLLQVGRESEKDRDTMNQKAYSQKQMIGMKYIGCWVTPELHERLKQLAEADERSLSGYVKKQLEKIAAQKSS